MLTKEDITFGGQSHEPFSFLFDLPHECGFGFMCAGGSVRALPSLHHQYALHAFAIYM